MKVNAEYLILTNFKK